MRDEFRMKLPVENGVNGSRAAERIGLETECAARKRQTPVIMVSLWLDELNVEA